MNKKHLILLVRLIIIFTLIFLAFSLKNTTFNISMWEQYNFGFCLLYTVDVTIITYLPS